MADYKLFTDATADMNEECVDRWSHIDIISMQVEIGGQNYLYGPDGNLDIKDFYELQRQGNFATTSQINPTVYQQYWTPVLEAGYDILYICFTSGLSGTYQAANIAAEDLREDFPERKIVIVDSLCAAVGEGLLVCEAADKKAQGMGIDELAQWVIDTRDHVCHWFTVDIFDHLKHGGRVSGTAAAVGAMLDIKPLLHVDLEGKLAVMEKPRGQKKARMSQLNHMKEGVDFSISKKVFIGHGDNLEYAEAMKALVLAEYPDAEIHTAYIGPVIGAHTGPGMLALIYFGNNK